MNKKDWIIRHLAQRLVWLGDCTFKKKDMDVCPMACLHTSAMQSQDICIDCVVESAEDAWAKVSGLQNGLPECPCSVCTKDDASNSDAVSFRIEEGQSDDGIPASSLGLLEEMHRAILSECEFGEDGKWHYYGKEKRK